MDIGPTGTTGESRDEAVRIWLECTARRMSRWMFFRRWLPGYLVPDVYERGYDDGYRDGQEYMRQ